MANGEVYYTISATTEHQRRVMETMQQLRSNRSFVDARLICKDGQIDAHKIVLAACSDYLKDILSQDLCNFSTLRLPDIKVNDLESVLDLVYQGKILIKESKIAGILSCADFLGIKTLCVTLDPPAGGFLSTKNEHEDNLHEQQLNSGIFVIKKFITLGVGFLENYDQNGQSNEDSTSTGSSENSAYCATNASNTDDTVNLPSENGFGTSQTFKGRKWTQETLQKALDEIKAKLLTVREASEKYSVPRVTLYSHCRDNDIELVRRRSWSENVMNNAINAIRFGKHSIVSVAKHYNLPYSSLFSRYQRLKGGPKAAQLGIKMAQEQQNRCSGRELSAVESTLTPTKTD